MVIARPCLTADRFARLGERRAPAECLAAIAKIEILADQGHDPRVRRARRCHRDTLVGSCELRLEDDRVARASYSIGPRARRRGFASRALQLAARWAFDSLGIARIELYVEIDNVASRGVARRCGFLEEGVLRGRLGIGDARRDAVLCAQLAADRSDE